MGTHLERILDGVRAERASRKATAPIGGLLRIAAARGPARELLAFYQELRDERSRAPS